MDGPWMTKVGYTRCPSMDGLRMSSDGGHSWNGPGDNYVSDTLTFNYNMGLFNI